MTKTKAARQAYGKKGMKTYKKINKIKKLVTGEGPTLLEKIASGVGGVASVAKAVLPAIAAINTEAKYYDKSFSATCYNPGTNDSIVDITSQFAQGTSDVTRIGNSVLAKEIYLKGYVYWLASTTIHSGVSRMTIICWKENLQVNAPTAAKIFEVSTDIYSPINKDYSDQFVVLKDKFFSHNAQISAATQQALIPIKFYKKLNWHLRWVAGATTDGSTNHIYAIFRGAAATSANQTTFNLYSRMNYTDN